MPPTQVKDAATPRSGAWQHDNRTKQNPYLITRAGSKEGRLQKETGAEGLPLSTRVLNIYSKIPNVYYSKSNSPNVFPRRWSTKARRPSQWSSYVAPPGSGIPRRDSVRRTTSAQSNAAATFLF